MTENLGRKITLTVVFTVLAIASLLIPEKPFRLGLDLQGGTRLVYRFDFADAAKRGQITPTELANQAALMESFRDIIHQRIDPKGVKEISIRTQGANELVIELPGAAEFSGQRVSWKLGAALEDGATDATLDAGPPPGAQVSVAERTAAIETIKAFPPSGGLIQVDKEHLAYASRDGTVLHGLKRGMDGTKSATHAAGASIELLSNDELEEKIQNVGDLQFMIVAEVSDPELARQGTDLTKERQKLDTWMAAHAGESIERFNDLAPDKGGPVSNLRWFPKRIGKGEQETPVASRIEGLLVSSNPEWSFNGSDLERVEPDTDHLGYPAVHLEIANAKKKAFGDFTEANIKRQMAIVLSGEIVTDPRINTKLPGSCVIEGGSGGFTQKEVADLVSVLKSGSLRVKPTLQDRSRVGASLGADYISTSIVSMGVALGVIVLFMLVFYRKLGLFSIVGLVLNLLYLLGGLAFLRATLTMPGVAGIILTLGMAVDGNILIYERLREELARGLKLVQAAKASFDRAATTIIDSNVTTLIAGVILQYVGTGPIRGFAVTLNIGILSTLFTVIVVTELLVLLDIKRGATKLSMTNIFRTPKIAFMATYKPFLFASWGFILAGMVAFGMLPENKKFGIDFLGGFTLKVRTEEPMRVEDLRTRIENKIQGEIAQAEVKEILDSAVAGKGYTLFSVTYKRPAGATESSSDTAGETQIRNALADILAKGPVLATVTPGDTQASVNGEIYFDSPHPPADIATELGTKGLRDATVEPLPNQAARYKFTATTDNDRTSEQVVALVRSAFDGKRDSAKAAYSLNSPVPESNMVGAQVGVDLRNKAVIALVLALLGTTLYLRIRFAELSFGIAVLVSLVHDVFMTITWISIAAWTGWISAEIDLAMVAAFLTIIGYSQNDTIVIFDRVRENRLKSNLPLSQVLNDSINQTLARTLLTTSTVLLTLLVLFLFNLGTRNVLEGFSFAMLVGVLSGAYSTVYIASPVLLWFERRQARKGGGTSALEPVAPAPTT